MPVGTIEVYQSRLAQVSTVAYVVVALWYLWWRSTNTVNWDAPLLALPLLAADYLGFAFFCLFAANLWKRWRRWAPPATPGLAVDVFIPTYNEPLSILRPTIVAAAAMEYPHKTYVLDDGKRDSVRDLCQELGVGYLTRSDNKGAKAGNINAALAKTSGEFIAIFDADHAPYRNFLVDLLGYFQDPKVALAQAPQSYYNLDSFQHGPPNLRSGGRAPWHEQSVFFDAVLPGRDRWNAVFWCGSTAIVRRTALEEMGGVDTRTITEDMHTAMGLHANGWKTVYHDRELALGIAPDDADAFLLQRLRWAQGAAQVFRVDNPLFKKGLTWRQKVGYFTSVAYVFEYVPRLIYLLMPALTLLTGVLPMENMGWNLVVRFGPYYLLGVLATMTLTGGTNPYFQAERFHLLKLWIMLQALTTVLVPRKLQFKVTPKGASGSAGISSLKIIRYQIGLGVLSALAVAWAFAGIALDAPWQLTGLSFVLTVAWAVFNAGLVFIVARSILVRRHRREVYRFDVDLPMRVSDDGREVLSRAKDFSALGVGWESPVAFETGQDLVCQVRTENGWIELPVKVTMCTARDGRFRVGGEFHDLSSVASAALIIMLFQKIAPHSLTTDGTAAISEFDLNRRMMPNRDGDPGSKATA